VGWFLLFVVLALATIGILGAVIKLTLIIVLSLIFAVVILAAAGWLWFQRWIRASGRPQGPDSEAQGIYDVRAWVRRDEPRLGDRPDPE
jgi:hypothetical protein